MLKNGKQMCAACCKRADELGLKGPRRERFVRRAMMSLGYRPKRRGKQRGK